MTAIKEKIIGAVTVMTDTDAKEFWEMILKKYSPSSWDDIEEEEPDEIDLQMLQAIADDPECHEFTSEKDINWNN